MYKRTRKQIREEHGTHTHETDGISAHQWTITDVSWCGLKRQGQKGLQTQFFFKHKYLANPKITPEYKVLAAAQILTQKIKGNVKSESEEMEALEKVAEIFETIEKRK